MSQNGADAVAHASEIKASDVYLMAVRLLAKHGRAAQEVAAFSEAEHALRGDAVRMIAWRAVKSTLNDMIEHHMPVTGIRIH